MATKTYSISKLARACGLSRSTLLYYDRLGSLKPSGRTGSGHRYYNDADQRRLKRIGYFREAGLSLKEIRAVLSSCGKPGTRLLETRLRDTAANIVALKNQQRLLAGMLRRVTSGKRPPIVDVNVYGSVNENVMWSIADRRACLRFSRAVLEDWLRTRLSH